VGNGCKIPLNFPQDDAKLSIGSAAQLVPAIADEAKSISQFIRVRSARGQWVIRFLTWPDTSTLSAE
jgi:hypothetical protein